jgi:3-dehydroquinate synthase
MAVDKKARDGRLRFILLKALGQAVIAADIDPVLLRATLESACQAVG